MESYDLELLDLFVRDDRREIIFLKDKISDIINELLSLREKVKLLEDEVYKFKG